tara:strand:- start:14406 stop:14579 length:174 start_codon:yes stop_codon:yes gene_type:complete
MADQSGIVLVVGLWILKAQVMYLSKKPKIAGGIHAQMKFWRQHLKACSEEEKKEATQ